MVAIESQLATIRAPCGVSFQLAFPKITSFQLAFPKITSFQLAFPKITSFQLAFPKIASFQLAFLRSQAGSLRHFTNGYPLGQRHQMNSQTVQEVPPEPVYSEPVGQIANDSPPIQPGQEWANAWTHGIAAVVWVGLTVWLVTRASHVNAGLAIACALYGASCIGTFTCSTLSHTFLERPRLDRFRAWDQAMIYLMIIGTYTPITYQMAEPRYRLLLLTAMWGFALWGFVNKAILNHRIHSISTLTYLLLGWLPAIPLYGRVSLALFAYVLAGGVIYSVGVLFLINDNRVKYFHAVWHLFVMTASIVHFVGIVKYVVPVPV